jgi:hypothetical protein
MDQMTDVGFSGIYEFPCNFESLSWSGGLPVKPVDMTGHLLDIFLITLFSAAMSLPRLTASLKPLNLSVIASLGLMLVSVTSAFYCFKMY